MRTERFGKLGARITGGTDGQGGGDGPVVVLMHGFGAPGDDLVGLARYLRMPPQVRFVFPEAPLTLDGFGPGRAWWMLDMAMFEARARGERFDRTDEVPPALPEVRAQMFELLAGVEKLLGVGLDRTVLGGFSQGSMVACDLALHSEKKPAGLVLLSSTLIARPVWQPLMASCTGMNVLQSHGRRDPLLAYDDAVRLADMFRAANANLTFAEFQGAHEIPPDVLAEMQRFLARVV